MRNRPATAQLLPVGSQHPAARPHSGLLQEAPPIPALALGLRLDAPRHLASPPPPPGGWCPHWAWVSSRGGSWSIDLEDPRGGGRVGGCFGEWGGGRRNGLRIKGFVVTSTPLTAPFTAAAFSALLQGGFSCKVLSAGSCCRHNRWTSDDSPTPKALSALIFS